MKSKFNQHRVFTTMLSLQIYGSSFFYSFSPNLLALTKFTFNLLKARAERSYIFSEKKNITQEIVLESHLFDKLHEARFSLVGKFSSSSGFVVVLCSTIYIYSSGL